MVTNNQTGLLVDVGDIHGIAAAMSCLNNDPSLCERLGAAARRTVLERYAPNKIWDSWELVIGKAIVHRFSLKRWTGP